MYEYFTLTSLQPSPPPPHTHTHTHTPLESVPNCIVSLLVPNPGGLAAFVDDGDNDGGEAGVDEEFTGNLFVSNEENLSDSEHLSIASHATDAGKQLTIPLYCVTCTFSLFRVRSCVSSR